MGCEPRLEEKLKFWFLLYFGFINFDGIIWVVDQTIVNQYFNKTVTIFYILIQNPNFLSKYPSLVLNPFIEMGSDHSFIWTLLDIPDSPNNQERSPTE